MIKGTVGQLLINDALPEDLRDYTRVLDKKGVTELFREVAKRYPERYKQILQDLQDLGADFASTKGVSVSLRHLSPGRHTREFVERLKAENQADIDDDTLDDDTREKRIVARTSKYYHDVEQAVMKDQEESGSPYLSQVRSGGRGNPAQLNQMAGAELLVADHKNNLVPIPLYSSYAEGVPPAEYWGSVYGTRRGSVSTKFATAESGFFCLAVGTKVRMADWSEKNIEDIVPGDLVLGADVQGNTFSVKVPAVFNNGPKDVVSYVLRKGRSQELVEVRCTREHKVLAKVKCGVGGGGRHTPTVMPIGARKTGLALVPAGEHLGEGGSHYEPYALLIGLLTGDGCLTGRTPTLATDDRDLIEMLKGIYESLGVHIAQIKGHAYEYLISGDTTFVKGLSNFKGRTTAGLTKRLRELGLMGKKSFEKELPAGIWSWDQESVAWYIAGLLESDGSVTHTKHSTLPVVKFGVTSEALARGLKDLLEIRFGIYSSSVLKAPLAKAREYNGHPVVSRHHCFHFCVANRDSLERLAKAIILPGRKGELLRSMMAAAASQVRDDSYAFALVSATPVGQVNTFDIEVDHPDHLFVLANGAIVSNSKQLALAAHRLVVNKERPHPHRLPVGLPVHVEDEGNVGAVLAKDAGPYKAGELLTPRILSEIKDKGVNEILVHSAITASDEEGGLDAWSAGSRERGGMAQIGDNVGIPAAQALSEPISQSALSEKHAAGGGKIGKKLGGFDYINKLFQAPEFFQEAAPLAPLTGIVKEIRAAPQGGNFVTVGDQELYVHPQHQVTVKPGEHVEVGDDLTDGFPHPRDLVKYRGVGAARQAFLNMAMEAFKSSGIKVHRRNVEPIVAGMINHMIVTDPNGAGDHILDDVVQYNRLAANYVPRDGAETIAPHKAVGRYLEEPALHYSIGTPVTKKVAEDLKKWGVEDIIAHKDAPPFASHWERLMTSTSQDPDWQTRLGGFYIGKSLVQSIHEGAKSDPRGTSFFPAIAQGVDFGEDLKTKGTY